MNIPDCTNRMALKFVFCVLSLLLLLPITWAADGFMKDASSGCAVFKPNLKPGETVILKGSCANGFAHGSGVAIWAASDGTSVTFEGNFVQGKLQGNGKMTASGGDRYQGEYKDGKREGFGVYTSANGDRFDGHYRDNQRDGHGILTLANGSLTEGEWRKGTSVSITSVTPPNAGLAGPKLGPPQPSTNALMPPGPSLAQSPPLLSPSQAMAPKQPTPRSSPTASANAPVDSKSSSSPPKATQEIRTTSGTAFRIVDCSGQYTGIAGVPPSSFDLRTSTPSNTYRRDEATGGIFPIIQEAIEFFKNGCPQHQGKYEPPIIWLFDKELPDPRNIFAAIQASNHYVRIATSKMSWSVTNGPADFAKKEDEQRKIREAEQEQKKQAAAQRTQENLKRSAFLNQYGAVEIPKMSILRSNPFSLEGKTIAIPVNFYQMTSPTVGIFEVLTYSMEDRGGQIVVSNIPKGTFLQPTQAFLAAKVVGLTPDQGNKGGAPHLTYVGAAICSNPNASCP